MFPSDNLAKIQTHASTTLLHLNTLKLPPLPDYYSLVYGYVSGEIAGLKGVVDAALAAGGLSVQKADALYKEHCTGAQEKNALQAQVKTVADELNHAIGIIGQSSLGTQRFNENLQSFNRELSKKVTLESLRQAVAMIAAEAQAMVSENMQLRQKLGESTEQLLHLRQDLNRAQKETVTDTLTGVGNRRHFIQQLKCLLPEADIQKTPLSLLILDLDFFKKFNDSYGHLVGDHVLRLVGRILTENLKGRDVVARYGGEEFVVILPQTRLIYATHVGEVLCKAVASKNIIRRDTNQSLGNITISVGVAEYHSGEKASALLRRADKGLYLAKSAGRNRVVAQDFNPLSPHGQEQEDAGLWEELDG